MFEELDQTTQSKETADLPIKSGQPTNETDVKEKKPIIEKESIAVPPAADLSDKENKVQESQEMEATFHVMPSAEGKMKQVAEKKQVAPSVRPSKTKPKSNLKFYLLIALVLIVVFGGGLTAFYLWYQQQVSSPIDLPTDGAEQPAEQDLLPIISSPAQVLTAEIKDNQDKIIGRAELSLPAGAIEPTDKPIFSGRLPKVEEIYGENYKVIGGIYQLEPVDLSLQKTAILTISYLISQIDARWEDKLVIAYRRNNQWFSLSGQVNKSKKHLTTSLSLFPSKIFALVISKQEIELADKEEEEIIPDFPSSIDGDRDGLTDVEENLYQSQKNNPDGDGDSYPDGLEVVNLYSPLTGPGVKLAISGLVGIYTNPTFGYSIFYPSAWLVRALPESDNEDVLFTAGTGEFIEVLVQNNLEKLSVLDWYLRQNPQLTSHQIKTIIISGQTAIWSIDQRSVYLANRDKIYILTYNFGGEKELNFKTTFLMMLKSFKLEIFSQAEVEPLICTNEAICFSQAVQSCSPAVVSVTSASGEFIYKKEVLGGRQDNCVLQVTYLKAPLVELEGKTLLCLIPMENLANYNDYLLGDKSTDFCQ